MSTLPAFASAEKVAASMSPGRLEQVGCPVCACNRHRAQRSGRDPSGTREEFLVVECAECGLWFTNPRPTVDAIGGYYPAEYLPHSRPARADRELRGWYPLDWLTSSASRPRLLDFGCGAGHFLSAMRRRGWEVAGVDHSSAAIDLIRAQGIPAFEGTLPREDLAPRSFDLATMWHALEHLHDPITILRETGKLLAPGGRLVLAVPNAAGWQSQWFGTHWFGLELPRHLTHFTAKSLTKTLNAAGFEIKGLRRSRHADWVRSSALRSWNEGPFSLSAAVLRHRSLSRLAAWCLSRGGWGDAILAWAEPRVNLS